MTLMTLIFDRSPVAKLIRCIDSPKRLPEQLEQLRAIMASDVQTLHYDHLEAACRRAEAALQHARDDLEKEALHDIYTSALRRIQRIHLESRP